MDAHTSYTNDLGFFTPFTWAQLSVFEPRSKQITMQCSVHTGIVTLILCLHIVCYQFDHGADNLVHLFWAFLCAHIVLSVQFGCPIQHITRPLMVQDSLPLSHGHSYPYLIPRSKQITMQCSVHTSIVTLIPCLHIVCQQFDHRSSYIVLSFWA